MTAKPATQLPQGRYPASPATTWVVAILVLLVGLALGVVVPQILPTGDDDLGAKPSAGEVAGELEGGNR